MSGVPDSVTEHVAGTADPTNKLNPELRNETATSKVTSNIAADGNGYKATISALPKDAEVTITFSAKTTDGMVKKSSILLLQKQIMPMSKRRCRTLHQYSRPFYRKKIHQ